MCSCSLSLFLTTTPTPSLAPLHALEAWNLWKVRAELAPECGLDFLNPLPFACDLVVEDASIPAVWPHWVCLTSLGFSVTTFLGDL